MRRIYAEQFAHLGMLHRLVALDEFEM